jgi:FKBP-type peptidyl-prolyl cis-trans isomerase SlyD
VKISKNCVALFEYTLKDGKGKTLDSSGDNGPLAYIHGLGNIIPGLELKLEGKQKGDKLNVHVVPTEGYGMRDEALVQEVPRTQFPEPEEIQLGMSFQVDSEQGPFVVTVTKLTDDSVTVDGNHPLAGVDLYFDINITEVRQATAEELAHRHVHGAGGHHH